MTDRPTLMVVHAHPDDESIGTGGILACYASEGVATIVVCATQGEAGEINDPELGEEVRERLGGIREEELRNACAVLGVNHLHFLGYRDSGMLGAKDNLHPQALVQADPDEAVARLVRLIRLRRPWVMVTYDEKGGYGHPDHIAVHRLAMAAFEAAGDAHRYLEGNSEPWQPQKLYYTAFPRSLLYRFQEMVRRAGVPSPLDRPDLDIEMLATPDERVTTRIDISAHMAQKLEAIACHRTQVGPDGFFLGHFPEAVPEGMGFEYFVRARSRCPMALPPVEDDLFAGLR